MSDTKFIEEEQNLLATDEDDCDVSVRRRRKRDYNTPLLTALWVATAMVMGVLIGVVFFNGLRKSCLSDMISGCEYFSISAISLADVLNQLHFYKTLRSRTKW